jgi:hypothetical protein
VGYAFLFDLAVNKLRPFPPLKKGTKKKAPVQVTANNNEKPLPGGSSSTIGADVGTVHKGGSGSGGISGSGNGSDGGTTRTDGLMSEKISVLAQMLTKQHNDECVGCTTKKQIVNRILYLEAKRKGQPPTNNKEEL